MNREHGRMQLVVPELQELVGKRAGTELREVFEDYEPVEIAQILREFSLRDKVYLFSLWDIDFAADIFAKLDEDMQIEVLGFIDDLSLIHI